MGKRKGKRLLVVSLGSTGWWDATRRGKSEKGKGKKGEKRRVVARLFSGCCSGVAGKK